METRSFQLIAGSLVVATLFAGILAHAEVYMVTEKCRISEKAFSLNTNLKSTVEDAISEHKYNATLRVNGQSIAMGPESELDETPMVIGSTYTLVDKASLNRANKKGTSVKPERKIVLKIQKAVEKSSFSSTKGNACAPSQSVKEYDVKVRGVAGATTAKMTCDQRSVFVSSQCRDDRHRSQSVDQGVASTL